MVRTGHWNQLKDEACQDVQHGTKRRVNEGNDGSATAVIFFLFSHDVSVW